MDKQITKVLWFSHPTEHTQLIAMRKAGRAVLYHCSEAATTESRHMFCEKDSNWCKMRKAEILGIPYSDTPGLPAAVLDKIMPIFQDLSKPELLEKCIHSKTQNVNEALVLFGNDYQRTCLLVRMF